MFHDLTKGQKRALRDALALAFERDRSMPREDREAHYLDVRTGDLPLSGEHLPVLEMTHEQ